MRKKLIVLFFMAAFLVTLCLTSVSVFAADIALPNIDINISPAEAPEEVSSTLQLVLIIAVLSLAPYIIVTLTSFTRIIIALSFVRSALGTQQMPPNQVLIGLALFLTLFIMSPTLTQINDTALKPYSAGEITQQEAIDKGLLPLREFMLAQVETKDMELFARLSGRTDITRENVPNTTLIPAFILGEITKGFRFGFIIFLPFIVVDMVVASTLMAMGMMMLPPAMIALPFKILLFVLLDGWGMTLEMLTRTFR